MAFERRDLFAAALASLVLFAINVVWFAYDHHIPNMDEAGHILSGLKYRDLFSEPLPLDIDWWSRLITVNQFYPPMVQALTGLLKVFTGGGRWGDAIVQSLFTALLTFSMVLNGRLMQVSLRASLIAAVVINFFPAVSVMNHQYMLDFPALGAVSSGILFLLWWWQRPSVKTAIITGIVLGICCMTKHTVPVFLVGAGCVLVTRIVLGRNTETRGQLTAQFVIVATCAVVVSLPWVSANYAFVQSIVNYMSDDLATGGQAFAFADNLAFYLRSAWASMTPFLFCLFALSTVSIGKAAHQQLLPVSITGLLGLMLMSTFAYPSERYVLSALIFPAYYLAVYIDATLEAESGIRKMTGALLVAIALLQFVSFNFMPYPIPAWQPLARFSNMLGATSNGPSGKGAGKDNPVREADWGYGWVLNLVAKHDRGAAVYLNVMANGPNVNAQTYSLFARERNDPVRPTTSRLWTVLGDTVDFSEEKALYFHWFLFKTGDNGFRFRDEKSENNYRDLFRFVKDGGRFRDMGSHVLPDGSALRLFRQLPRAPSGSEAALMR